MKNKVISNLDFIDLSMYMDCIKGKQTDTLRKLPQEVHNFLKLYIPIYVDLLNGWQIFYHLYWWVFTL